MNKVMIFAAGLGTRLRPLTDHMPKALVPVGGVPLLERLLLKLKASGFTDITLNLHHFADQIAHFLAENGNFGLTIRLSDERDLLRDTGGGIRHAIPLLQEDADGSPVLVHNIDILSNADLPSFARQYREGDAATLLVSERQTSRYLLFDDDLRLVGWTNLRTGEVKSPYPGLDPARRRSASGRSGALRRGPAAGEVPHRRIPALCGGVHGGGDRRSAGLPQRHGTLPAHAGQKAAARSAEGGI